MRVDGEQPVRTIVREILRGSPRTGLALAETIDVANDTHVWLVLFGDGQTLFDMGEVIKRDGELADMAALLNDTTKRIVLVIYQDLPTHEITPHVVGYTSEADAKAAAARMNELIHDEMNRLRAADAVDAFLTLFGDAFDEDEEDLDDESFGRRKTHD